MKKITIKKTCLTLMLISTLVLSQKMFAALPPGYKLSQPISTYNSIGEWTRALEPANKNYNCLAYAVDAGTVKGHYNTYWWEWPWGKKAHYGQVNGYMFDKGYKISDTPIRAEVMSYGKDLFSIEHFAKSHAQGSAAKWGPLEVMLSPNWDPYVGKSDGYGRLQERYIK